MNQIEMFLCNYLVAAVDAMEGKSFHHVLLVDRADEVAEYVVEAELNEEDAMSEAEWVEFQERVRESVRRREMMVGSPLLAKLPERFRWTPHNLVAHPVSEILHQLGFEELGGRVHDMTIPRHMRGEGRG